MGVSRRPSFIIHNKKTKNPALNEKLLRRRVCLAQTEIVNKNFFYAAAIVAKLLFCTAADIYIAVFVFRFVRNGRFFGFWAKKMSSDNLDSGCSTCDSEKSDTDLAATNHLLGLINVDNSPRSPPQIQKNCFGSSTSGESRSSSQESFAKILNFNHNSAGVAGSAPTAEPKSPGAVSSNGGTPNSRRRSKIATGAEKIRFRFPAVKFFSNKKKSWPNLNSSTVSSTNGVVLNEFNGDIINNSIETTANIGESNPMNGFGLFRIKNMTRYSSLEHSDPEIRADESNPTDPLMCDRRRKACRLPSKEDPGPQREILGVFCDPTAVFGASATTPSPATTTSKSISCPTISNPSNGTKLKFVREGQIQICKLNHPRTVLGKLTSSKLLRRWENHFLVLDDDEISSKTVKKI